MKCVSWEGPTGRGSRPILCFQLMARRMKFKDPKQTANKFLSTVPVGEHLQWLRRVTDDHVIWSSEQGTEAQNRLKLSSQPRAGKWQSRAPGSHLLYCFLCSVPPSPPRPTPTPSPPWPVTFPSSSSSSRGRADTQRRSQLREDDAQIGFPFFPLTSIFMKLFLNPTFFCKSPFWFPRLPWWLRW